MNVGGFLLWEGELGRLREYTRIKHSVLMDIFAEGKLTKREMQVACVVIRESWGWHGGNSNWTKRQLPHTLIAQLTKIERRNLIKTLRSMLKRNILQKNDEGQYSFNEHPDTWVCQNNTVSRGVKKTHPKGLKRHRGVCHKDTERCVKKTHLRILGAPALSYNLKGLRQLTKLSKERFKERFKETLKEMVSHTRNYYQEKIERKLRTFGEVRQKMVLARLENFSLAELKQVIHNISMSDWNMGRDPKSKGKAYNDFELLFKNDAKVEQYLALKPREAFAVEKEWIRRGQDG